MPSPNLKVSREIISKYRQMNECLLTNVEFLECRMVIALDQAQSTGRREAIEECAKIAEESATRTFSPYGIAKNERSGEIATAIRQRSSNE